MQGVHGDDGRPNLIGFAQETWLFRALVPPHAGLQLETLVSRCVGNKTGRGKAEMPAPCGVESMYRTGGLHCLHSAFEPAAGYC